MNVRGGAERKVFLLYQFLKTQGHTVKIITFDYDKENTFSKHLDYHDVIIIDRSNFIRQVIFKLGIRRWDVLICSNYPANIYSYFIPARRKIFVCNEVALVRWLDLGNRVSKLKRFIDKLSIKQFNSVVANSMNTAGEIKKHYALEPKIVYSGLEMQYMADLSEQKIPHLIEKNFYFTLSRASYDKNISFLPKVLKYMAEHCIGTVMVFAGSGPDKEYLETLEIEYDNFIYLGKISEGEKKWLLGNCRKFLFLPKNEPLGVTVLEALFYGATVIAFNKGGPKEILLPFKEYLVDTESNYLYALISEAKRYEKNNVESWLNERFNADNMCAKIIGELCQK